MRRSVSPAWAFAPLALIVLAAAMLARRRRAISCRGGWTWETSPEAPEDWR